MNFTLRCGDKMPSIIISRFFSSTTNQDLLRLPSPPKDPIWGDTYYNTLEDVLYTYGPGGWNKIIGKSSEIKLILKDTLSYPGTVIITENNNIKIVNDDYNILSVILEELLLTLESTKFYFLKNNIETYVKVNYKIRITLGETDVCYS